MEEVPEVCSQISYLEAHAPACSRRENNAMIYASLPPCQISTQVPLVGWPGF